MALPRNIHFGVQFPMLEQVSNVTCEMNTGMSIPLNELLQSFNYSLDHLKGRYSGFCIFHCELYMLDKRHNENQLATWKIPKPRHSQRDSRAYTSSYSLGNYRPEITNAW